MLFSDGNANEVGKTGGPVSKGLEFEKRKGVGKGVGRGVGRDVGKKSLVFPGDEADDGSSDLSRWLSIIEGESIGGVSKLAGISPFAKL